MGTFSNLKNLETLDVSNNPGLRFSMKEYTSSIQNTSITRLRMNNTRIWQSAIKTADIIRGFCHLGLKELTLDNNFINVIDPVFHECLPTLELLSMGDNDLAIQHGLLNDTIFGLTSLRGFNISAQRRAISQKAHDYSENTINSQMFCVRGMTCPIYLPPNIQWIDMSQNGFILLVVPQIVLMNNNSLNFLNGSYNGIHNIRHPIYCAYNSIIQLETFDLSNNGMQCINATIFNKNITHCDWTALKILYLGNNEIGRIEKNSCNKEKHNVLGFIKPCGISGCWICL